MANTFPNRKRRNHAQGGAPRAKGSAWAAAAALLLSLCIGSPVSGTAQSAEGAYTPPAYALTLTGNVVAGETALVTAPYGGRLGAFNVREGDLVTADQVLFSVVPTEVYAPCDGTVVGLRPDVGDDAAFIQDRYGALLYLEPTNPFLIETSTENAYNASENHNIHIGEMVYIESRTYFNKSGVGYVTDVDGENYTVEVFGGNLVLHDEVAIYREPDFVGHSKIGSGTITRNKMVPITSEGSVLTMHIIEGDSVRRGDLLLEMVQGTLPGNTKPQRDIVAGVSGIVATIAATAGGEATAQQVLATIYPTDGLQIAATVHELDLYAISVGDAVRIDFLGLRTEEPTMGRVESISALNVSESGDAQYHVYVSFQTEAQIRMGMSATIYVNE